MSLKSWIRSLHRKGIVTEKPHPIWPFLLALVAFILGISVFSADKLIGWFFFILSGLTLIFAIVHLIVASIIKSK